MTSILQRDKTRARKQSADDRAVLWLDVMRACSGNEQRGAAILCAGRRIPRLDVSKSLDDLLKSDAPVWRPPELQVLQQECTHACLGHRIRQCCIGLGPLHARHELQ